jgi:hypothetical protein
MKRTAEQPTTTTPPPSQTTNKQKHVTVTFHKKGEPFHPAKCIHITVPEGTRVQGLKKEFLHETGLQGSLIDLVFTHYGAELENRELVHSNLDEEYVEWYIIDGMHFLAGDGFNTKFPVVNFIIFNHKNCCQINYKLQNKSLPTEDTNHSRIFRN